MLEATVKGNARATVWGPPLDGPASTRDQHDSRRVVAASGWLVALLPLTLASIGLSLGVVVLLIAFRESLLLMGGWGYLGVSLGEFANSAAIFIPTPGPAYTFAMGSVLDPFALGIVGGVGAACGDLVGYYLGARGRKAIGLPRAMRRMQVLTSRWGGGALLAFAILPIPFDVAGIWAGAARYPLPKFLLFVVPGKVVKVTMVALAGSYGFHWLAGPVG